MRHSRRESSSAAAGVSICQVEWAVPSNICSTTDSRGHGRLQRLLFTLVLMSCLLFSGILFGWAPLVGPTTATTDDKQSDEVEPHGALNKHVGYGCVCVCRCSC